MKLLSIAFRIVAFIAACGAGFLAYQTMGIVKEADDALAAETSAHKKTTAELQDVKNQYDMEKSRHEGTMQDLDRAKNQVSSVKRDLASIRREKADLEQEKTSLTDEKKQLSQEVSKLKQELIAERTKVPDIDPKELEDAEAEIAQLKKEKKDLKSELETAQAKIVQMQKDPLGSMASTGSAESPDAGDSGKAAVPTGGISAKVLVVRPLQGLMVLNLGSDKSLKDGMELSVVKDGRLMAKMKVTRALKGQSVGTIIPGEGIPLMLNDNDSVQVSL